MVFNDHSSSSLSSTSLSSQYSTILGRRSRLNFTVRYSAYIRTSVAAKCANTRFSAAPLIPRSSTWNQFRLSLTFQLISNQRPSMTLSLSNTASKLLSRRACSIKSPWGFLSAFPVPLNRSSLPPSAFVKFDNLCITILMGESHMIHTCHLMGH